MKVIGLEFCWKNVTYTKLTVAFIRTMHVQVQAN